jgi:squalene synthase HpnC
MNNKTLDISSGKDAAYENFPVGSWLLPAALRPHIAAFYQFARAADDIADSPDLSPDDKIAGLIRYEDTVTGKPTEGSPPPKAWQMAKSLEETKVSPQHCLDLLTAFKLDATKLRYNTQQELFDYCQLSAAPVGRYLIDLHFGFRSVNSGNYGPSDALCAALQILNHVQDCQDDYQKLNRVYLPLNIMATHCAKVEELSAAQASPSLRACLDDILDSVDNLMREAAKLPTNLKSHRLAIESQVIINIAKQLSKKLRRNDPILSQIKLSKPAYTACCITGLFRSLIR